MLSFKMTAVGFIIKYIVCKHSFSFHLTVTSLTNLCSVHRNPPRFQTLTPMRKHGPTTCLAWTPAGVQTPQLLPCSHGRKAAIVWPTPAQKVSQCPAKYSAHFRIQHHPLFCHDGRLNEMWMHCTQQVYMSISNLKLMTWRLSKSADRLDRTKGSVSLCLR